MATGSRPCGQWSCTRACRTGRTPSRTISKSEAQAKRQDRAAGVGLGVARRTGGWAPAMRACDSAGSGCGLGRCGGKPAGCPEPGWAHGPRGARRRTVGQARRRRRATWEPGRRPCALATRPGTPAAPTRSGTSLTCSPSRFAPLRQGPAASAARSPAGAARSRSHTRRCARSIVARRTGRAGCCWRSSAIAPGCLCTGRRGPATRTREISL